MTSYTRSDLNRIARTTMQEASARLRSMGKLRGRPRLDSWEVRISQDSCLTVYYTAERLQLNGVWLRLQLGANCAI